MFAAAGAQWDARTATPAQKREHAAPSPTLFVPYASIPHYLSLLYLVYIFTGFGSGSRTDSSVLTVPGWVLRLTQII